SSGRNVISMASNCWGTPRSTRHHSICPVLSAECQPEVTLPVRITPSLADAASPVILGKLLILDALASLRYAALIIPAVLGAGISGGSVRPPPPPPVPVPPPPPPVGVGVGEGDGCEDGITTVVRGLTTTFNNSGR